MTVVHGNPVASNRRVRFDGVVTGCSTIALSVSLLRVLHLFLTLKGFILTGLHDSLIDYGRSSLRFTTIPSIIILTHDAVLGPSAGLPVTVEKEVIFALRARGRL